MNTLNYVLLFGVLGSFFLLSYMPRMNSLKSLDRQWLEVLLTLALICTSFGLAGVTASDGLLDWLPVSGIWRIILALLCWAGVLAGMALLVAWQEKTGWGGKTAQNAIFYGPFLLIALQFFLLIFGQGSIGWVNMALKIEFGIGFLVCLAGGVYARKAARRRQAQRTEQIIESSLRVRNQRLETVQALRPENGLRPLLVYTGSLEDDTIRLLAVEKVKSFPDWEEQLLQLLDSDEYHEAYGYLDGNPVDHPGKFLKPLERSFHRMAAAIRDKIHRHAAILEPHHLSHYYGVEYGLRVLDQPWFTQAGVDFRPVVRDVLDALHTPFPKGVKSVTFEVTAVVKAWLRRH